MAQIIIKDLTFCYEGSVDPVFEDVSITLSGDWRLGVTGPNGRGKTTLLRLLNGRLSGFGGRLDTGGMRFSYFPAEVDADEQRGFIEVAETLCSDFESWRLYAEADMLGVDAECLSRPFCTLSGGEKTKLLLAILFVDSNFPLIDEPTNHLDLEGRAKVGEYLRRKSGFMLVSHDRALLDACTDHTLSINKTGIAVEKGGISVYLENKRRRESMERKANERLSRDIERLTEAAARTSGWADKRETAVKGKTGIEYGNVKPDKGFESARAAKTMRRAKAVEKRVLSAADEKRGLLKDIERADPLRFNAAVQSGVLLRFAGVGFSYPDKPVLTGVSFDLGAGQRLAVTGANGSGKSTLLHVARGVLEPDAGQVYRKAKRVAYVPQDTSFLSGSITAFESEYPDLDVPKFRAVLIKFGFLRSHFDMDIRAYSAGQKKKLLLAAALCVPADLYILDEPLNYIDLYARLQIEQSFLESPAAMLFVEHDRAFVDAVATGVLTL